MEMVAFIMFLNREDKKSIIQTLLDLHKELKKRKNLKVEILEIQRNWKKENNFSR
jgi:hypothetical protein